MVTGLLVQLFNLMKLVDEKVDRVNLTAPNGVMRRLRRTEATARDIPNDAVSSITKLVKLPTLVIGRGDAPVSWPPPVPNWGLEYIESMNQGFRNAAPPLTEQQKAEASARHVALGVEMERESERLRSVAAAG
jgi:hypothetical protein